MDNIMMWTMVYPLEVCGDWNEAAFEGKIWG